ncbi:TolC family protein [Thalassomonas actiniarum]|uniref:TolC family protein n=1 Tax=Thalassomonas actiniarum TaxID=485447 RepID=A0AAE9YQ74_9GAMM|nr:TolC family protein [Thalassomonas actiniarum]WDD98652.1 TolC family protein [Thalassomonas actiniarum]
MALLSRYFKPVSNPAAVRVFARSVIAGAVLSLGSPLSFADDAAREPGQTLSFGQTIKQALANDPWLNASRYKQSSLESMSRFSATLPDPKVSLALANLGTDKFDLEQEAMTQLKVGVSQMFPRGDSLQIKQQQLNIQSQQHPLQRRDREAKVTVTAGSLWLDAYLAQESIALIEKNYALFEQLSDVAQASYSSALGKTRQQDIVRSQLELTRLEDRLVQLKQQQLVYQQKLTQWLLAYQEEPGLNQAFDQADFPGGFSSGVISLDKEMPELDLLRAELLNTEQQIPAQQLARELMAHPVLAVFDKKILAADQGIKLAKQSYLPEWGVNASYGLRGDDAMGNNRADLFSVGVTFDLPLFTENRQDQLVKAQVLKSEAIKTEKLLLLRQLMSAFYAGKAKLKRLEQRNRLYLDELLPQIHLQAEASLTAYTSDDGDFAEVVRARIAELNAEIDALAIRVGIEKTILELNYLFINAVAARQSHSQVPADRAFMATADGANS